jgi:hypothetical protein
MMRNDNRTPELPLSVQGASARPALLRYETLLVNFTDPSRPSRVSLNVSGNVTLAPGQRSVQPVRLNVNWSFIPYNAEYHVTLQLAPLHNALAASQPDDVALFIFGTPYGHCPPGTSLGSSSSGASLKDLAPYANSAPLQDMHLSLFNASNSSVAKELDPPFEPLEPKYLLRIPFGTNRSQLDLGSTRNGDLVQLDASGCSGLSSQSWLVAVPKGKNLWRAAVDLSAQRAPCSLTVNVLVYQNGTGGAYAASSSSSVKSLAAGNGTNLTVLVPADGGSGGADGADAGSESGASTLLPSDSSSSSDTAADGNSTEASPASLARISAALRAANSTVASNVTAAALNSTIYSVDASSAAAQQPADDAVSATNRTLVLYKSYTLKVVPMTDPQNLQLRAITFRNMTHIVVACGEPSDVVSANGSSSWPSPPPSASSSGDSSGSGSGSGSGSNSSSSLAFKGMEDGLSDGNDPEGEDLQQQRQQAVPGSKAGTNSSITTVAAVGNTTLVLQKTVIWYSRQAQVACDPNRYILVPFSDLSVSMTLQPELQFPGASGVALDVSGQYVLRQAAAGSGAGTPSLRQRMADSISTQSLPGSSSSAAPGSSSGGGRASSGSDETARNALPADTVELPVIVKLDGGLSSRTFTMLLYSNHSSVTNLSTSISTRQNISDTAATAADLQELVFGGRPASWPRSPAQNGSCAICPHGTFSSKLDSGSCQACPPGKYARSPLASACEPCPTGTFAFSWGSYFCRCARLAWRRDA